MCADVFEDDEDILRKRLGAGEGEMQAASAVVVAEKFPRHTHDNGVARSEGSHEIVHL